MAFELTRVGSSNRKRKRKQRKGTTVSTPAMTNKVCGSNHDCQSSSTSSKATSSTATTATTLSLGGVSSDGVAASSPVSTSTTDVKANSTVSKEEEEADEKTNTPPFSATLQNNKDSSNSGGSSSNNTIEFVYPRAQSGKTFLFTPKRQLSAGGPNDNEQQRKEEQEAKAAAKRTNETIDDIFQTKKKRKGITTAVPLHVRNSESSILKINDEELVPAKLPPVYEESKATPSSIKKLNNNRTTNAKKKSTVLSRSVEEAVQLGRRPRANSTDGELQLPQRGLCDELQIQSNFKWNLNQGNNIINNSHKGKATPRGLRNLGNTCFLNATIQCLAYVPTFSQSLQSLQILTDEIYKKNKRNGKKMSVGLRVTVVLQRLFRQIHSNKIGSGDINTNANSIAPYDLVQAVPLLGSIASARGYKFRQGRQEDAHEFLVHLLDAMQDGELRRAGINQHKSGWRDRLPLPRLDETTLVHRTFGGYFRSQVKCGKCNYSSNTYDPFLDLALEVSRKNCTSLRRALQDFARQETLDADNRWRCSSCRRHVRATKQLTVFRPPLCLCIQLKRFTFSGSPFYKFGYSSMGGGGSGSKISKPIEFPVHLQLPLSDGRRCHYALTGIVLHHGHSATSGHYTAFCKTPAGTWYHMDDSHTDPVKESTVLRQQQGVYLLFYSRTEVKLELPSPPPFANTSVAATATAAAKVPTKDDNGEKRENEHAAIQRKPQPRASSFERKKREEKEERRKPEVMEKDDKTKKKEKRRETMSVGEGAIKMIPSEQRHSAKIEEIPATSTDAKSKIEEPKENASSSDDDEPSSSSSSSSASTSPSSIGKSSESSSSNSSSSEDEGEGEGKGNKANETTNTEKTQPELPYQQQRGQEDAFPLQQRPQNNSVFRTPSTLTIGKSSPPTDMAVDERYGGSADEDSKSESNEEATGRVLLGRAPTESTASTSVRDDKGPGPIPKDKNGGRTSQSESKAAASSSVNSKTRITMDRGGTKVEVMMGSRFLKGKRVWKPKAAAPGRKDERHELLGSVSVGKWGSDDDDDEDGRNAAPNPHTTPVRGNIIKQMQREESTRKRKMYLDRYDAALDLGKRKKVKAKKAAFEQYATSPQENAFHKIQSSLQQVFKGRAKGRANTNKFRTPTKNRQHQKHSYSAKKHFRG